MEVLEHFDYLEARAVVQKNWPGKKPQAIDELNRWNVFAEGYAQPLLLKWREHRYEPVMRAIRPARDVYDRLRRERKGLNFQDLLLRSVSLLRDNPGVRRYFRQRFSHVLVDEFQDTDPIQAEVMLLLASDDDRETDWRKCRPVPGALFVVGDPKQSIYRFRRADIVTYSRVRSIIESAGGAVVSLSTNFRSSKPIVEWVNQCFDEVFPVHADAYNPAKRPLDAGRRERTDCGPNLECLDIPPGLRWPREIAEFEADRIARTIRQAIDERWPIPRTESEQSRGVPPHAQPGDFLIVAKSRARLTVYGRKLQHYGLPHLVTGGHGLNDVPELELLRLCVSAVIRNDDPIALVAALRSPLFGISDSLLYDFRRHGGRFHYRSDIPTALPEEDAAVLCDAFRRLRTYAGDLHRMPPAAAIERIAADLGLVAHAGAGEAGNVHAGGLLKAMELLRSMEGSVTASDVTTLLDRLVDGEDAHDGAVARPFSEPPVRVMNLHQCKGLEAPFVFLVDPSGESEHDVGLYIDRSSDQAKGYLPIYGRKRSQYGRPPLLAHPPGWETLAAEEQKFLDSETNRLLYVAATRAGVKLVISQPQDGNADAKNPWRMLAGSLKDAGPLADPHVGASAPPVPLPFEPAAWDRENSVIADRWRTVLKPSYSVQAIKEAAIRGNAKPHGAEAGGAEWGTVLHSLLESTMKHPEADLHSLAVSALVSEELPIELVDQVIETVQRVIGSDLWHRARNSLQCLTEVPVMTLADPAGSGGLPTIHRGVIDLVFLEEAGWVIVDYKSERVEALEIPKLVSYYTPQIDAYAEVWQRIVGQPVAERGIFFSHTGNYVSV
ncbi:MAG: UvrD-helicase domain-containing protein [Gemmataceae bacterium]